MPHAIGFQVEPRYVGTNPSDPDGLRRSQRAVLEVIHYEADRVAFHGPTGCGKSHLLRAIAKRNATGENPVLQVYTYPIHALVNQQAMEVGARCVAPEQALAKLRERASMDPEGPIAKALAEFDRTCILPREYRTGTLVSEMLQGDPRVPLALTPDSLAYAVKGVLAAFNRPPDPERIGEVLNRSLGKVVNKALLDLARDEVVGLADPNRVGVNTAKRIASILGPLARRLERREAREALLEAVQDMTCPAELVPGAKYRYDPETAQRLRDAFRGALVVFDEYHLLAAYPGFRRTLNRLQFLGARVLLLSGTPRMDLLESMSDFRVLDFDEIENLQRVPLDEPKVLFNQPLDMTVEAAGFQSQAYQPQVEAFYRLKEWDDHAPGPCVFIYESVRRALQVRDALGRDVRYRDRVMVWTGPEKDPALSLILGGERELPKDAIVVGTSALELGVDLAFRNGCMEALHHDTLMQRLGRIGRMGSYTVGEEHRVVIQLNRTVVDSTSAPRGPVRRHELDEVLRNLLSLKAHRPDEEYEGLYFRGNQRFQVLAMVKTSETWKVVRGSQDLMRVYPPAQAAEGWAFHKPAERRDTLVEMGVSRNLATQVLFQDGFAPSTIAYVSNGASPQAGSLKTLDQPGPNPKKVLRVWQLNGKAILRALVPAPKKKPFVLKTVAIS